MKFISFIRIRIEYMRIHRFASGSFLHFLSSLKCVTLVPNFINFEHKIDSIANLVITSGYLLALFQNETSEGRQYFHLVYITTARRVKDVTLP